MSPGALSPVASQMLEVATHVPEMQDSVEAQACPQAPQSLASYLSSWQRPSAHGVSPGEQL